MQVKTYSGTSTTALLGLIKSDLGPDAVILETREVKESGKKKVLMTAAVDRGESAASGDNGGARKDAAPQGMPQGWKMWHEEWSSIKSHLLAMMRPGLQLDRLSPRQRVAVEFLEREGVDDSALLELTNHLLSEPGSSILAPLSRMLPVRAWGADVWPQKTHLIAGPYGAGKTTTLIRLALWLRKTQPKRKIWLVNADAERGGGRLLLKNYAELSDLEYREVANPVEFASVQAEARSRKADTLLVDLPALPRGKTMEETLTRLGMTDTGHALHLVMPPHLDPVQIRAVLARYWPGNGAKVREGSLIWVKLDETEKFGTLVNVSMASRLPISALSFGPGLRGTLLPATEGSLWRLLFKRELPDAAL